jgi:hypothetical protein
VARGNSSVEAWGNSSVEAWGNSSVVAWENSSVVAWENSSVVARGNSSVVARDNSSVVAWENSSVVARGNSSVVAYQFALIAVMSTAVLIKHLADYAVASLRGVKPEILKKDETATVVETPSMSGLNISFETWLERGYVLADGIYQKFVSRKTLGDVEVFTVQNFPKKDESFVVRRGDLFSHGKTVEEAIKDLRFKLSDRDTSRFESWTMKTKVAIDDAIQSYRAITGACEFGTKHFCAGIELPNEITVAEVIERTLGQFGNEQYRRFFDARA